MSAVFIATPCLVQRPCLATDLPGDWVRINAAARHLHTTTQHVHQLAEAGRLTAHLVAGVAWFDIADLYVYQEGTKSAEMKVPLRNAEPRKLRKQTPLPRPGRRPRRLLDGAIRPVLCYTSFARSGPRSGSPKSRQSLAQGSLRGLLSRLCRRKRSGCPQLGHRRVGAFP